MSEESDPGVSRGESAVLQEFRALRAELLAADVKRDTIVQHGKLLAQSVDTLKTRVEEIAKRDQDDHDDLRVAIKGMQTSLDGNDEKPGLRTRVDRLEQSQIAEKKVREWLARIAAALVASGITAIVAWFIHSKASS